MMNSAVLFDFDGTLFYGTTDINFYVINLALADMGLPGIDRETANASVGDKLALSCARILSARGAAGRTEELLRGMLSHTAEAIESCAGIEPDCLSMLEALSKKAKLAICSNAEPDYLFALLDKLRIRHFFDYVWYSTPGYDKTRAIPELGRLLGAERLVMVGDREEDVRAGKANGCVTVAIQNDFGARDALGADYDVYNHAQMAETILRVLEDFGGGPKDA